MLPSITTRVIVINLYIIKILGELHRQIKEINNWKNVIEAL